MLPRPVVLLVDPAIAAVRRLRFHRAQDGAPLHVVDAATHHLYLQQNRT